MQHDNSIGKKDRAEVAYPLGHRSSNLPMSQFFIPACHAHSEKKNAAPMLKTTGKQTHTKLCNVLFSKFVVLLVKEN